MRARPEQLPTYYYTSFRTYAKCQGLIVIHEKTLKKIHQQKTFFAPTMPVMSQPSFLNRHEDLEFGNILVLQKILI